MKIASALVVVVGVLVGHAVPPVDVPAGPGGRNKPGFVYDSARKSFVLFGGFGSGSPGLHDDTWEWNGARWTRVDAPGPSARGAMGMAYDSIRKRAVLFGGADATSQLGDTWEWDGGQWTRIDPVATSVLHLTPK